MSERETMTEVQKKLAKLGEMEPGEIADFFEREGVRGRRECSGACPVANYLSTAVDMFDVYHEGVCQSHPFHEYVADLPETVAKFVAEFDAGSYSSLAESA